MTAAARRQRVVLVTFEVAEGLRGTADLSGINGAAAPKPPRGFAAPAEVSALLVPPGTHRQKEAADAVNPSLAEARHAAALLSALLGDGVLELHDPRESAPAAGDGSDDGDATGGGSDDGDATGDSGGTDGADGAEEVPEAAEDAALTPPVGVATSSRDAAADEEEAESPPPPPPMVFEQCWLALNPEVHEALRLLLADVPARRAAQNLDALGRGYLEATEILIDRFALAAEFEKAGIVREQLLKERHAPGGQLAADGDDKNDRAWVQAKLALQTMERRLVFSAAELKRRRDDCAARRTAARREVAALSRVAEARLDESEVASAANAADAAAEEPSPEGVSPSLLSQMETFVRTSILGDGEHEPAGAATEYAWARADWDARGGDWSFGYFYGTDEEKQVQAILAAPPEAGAAFTEDEILAAAADGRFGAPLDFDPAAATIPPPAAEDRGWLGRLKFW
mmetsp:Transcript_42334/g.132706  ORF Transcript_42334/g.132706 Transcript_42334/m.132706 type:complete len:457 (-) Transcript_42334:50-1420(-)